MKKLILTLCNLIVSFAVFGQVIQVGQKAPQVAINQWIKPTNPINLTNKALLIDFWATWCAPCIEGFPHLDSLNKKYGDRINFIAMTTDKAETVQKFLKRMPLNTSVVIDKDGEANKNFQVEFIPTAILIDAAGTIQWIGLTKKLTEQAINEFLQTGKINDTTTGKIKPWQTETTQSKEEVPPFHKFTITDGAPVIKDGVLDEGGIMMGARERAAFIKVRNKVLPGILQYLIGKTNPYFNFQSNKKNIYLHIEYRSKIETTEEALAVITKQLLSLYQLKLDNSKVEKEVWVAEVVDTAKLNKRETVLSSKASSLWEFKNEGKTFYVRGGSIKNLLENMENKFGIPLFIKKEPNWTYDYEVSCESFEAFRASCLKELGIAFKPVKKKVTVVTIKDK